MFKLNRRQALRSMIYGGSLAAFGGLATMGDLTDAHAEEDLDNAIPERYYVFCYFSGAWDILLSLDPRDPGLFHNGNRTTTRIQPGYDLLGYLNDPRIAPRVGAGSEMMDAMGQPVHFGPFIGDLANNPELTQRMVVVRGMSMDTLTHQVGRRRFLTGKPPSGLSARGSSTDAWLASYLGQSEPLPNLAIRTESYNKGLGSSASALQAGSSEDLLRVLSPGAVQLDGLQEAQLDKLLEQHALCEQTRISNMLSEAEETRLKSRSMLSNELDRYFDFQARTDEMAALRDQFNIQNNSSGNSPEVQAAIAGVALTRGVSRCVSIEAARGLDTHFENWIDDQGPTQQRGFDAVANLAKYLLETPYTNKQGQEDGNWLDRTLIVGFSEFSRTPLINANSGRDHWLGNSCFLLGGGIRGGRVLGRSSDFGMYPQKVNLLTGELDEGGETIRPEHIIRAIYDQVGIGDEPDLRVDGLSAIFS